MFNGNIPKGEGGVWQLVNELKPSDLYCYLTAKFGPPNGIQNFIKDDDSDNFIHWEWALAHPKNGLILIMGMSMRTEVHFWGEWAFSKLSKKQFIDWIKSDFRHYGKEMTKFRKENLEHWEMFVNPYSTLRSSLDQLSSELDVLNLNPENEELTNPTNSTEFESFPEKWKQLSDRYMKGIGLAIGIRTMTPIKAEAFLNLLIFILCKPDIKQNERIYQDFIRSNIDIKAQLLHINCIGFKQAVDWASDPCSNYNTLVNDRNDLLHGNLVIGKQKFDEIFFLGKTPVFKEYKSIWQQSLGTSITASKLDCVKDGLKIVEEFEQYILSCLKDQVREQIEHLINLRDLGYNKQTGRVGVLLPDYVADFGFSTIHT